MSVCNKTAAFAFCCFLLCSHCFSAIYVDTSSTGPVFDGTSWSRAYKTIGDAIKQNKGTDIDIWVKAGTYPEHLSICKNLNIYGGFLGYETSLDQRIDSAFPSIIDAKRKDIAVNIASAVTVTLDGFSIRHGYGARGGGICTAANTVAKIYNCRIENCEAAEYAGGVYYANYAQGEMDGCIISHNKAPYGGGAVIEYHCYPTIKHDIFSRNTAYVSGGGIYCPFHSGAYLENCTIAYNTANTSGGGLYAYYGGPVTLKSCIVAFNSSPDGGGLYGGGDSSQAVYSYCDLYGNQGGDIGGKIQTMPSYDANFSSDPLFLMPENDEYHVKSDSLCTSAGAYPLASVYKMSKIGFAKLLPDGTNIELAGKIVTLSDNGRTYIEEPDRSASIALNETSGCSRGSIVSSLDGILQTDANGSRYIQTSSEIISNGAFYSIRPLGTNISCLSNMMGFYVRIWGKVEATAPNAFAIRDGNTLLTVQYNNNNVQTGNFVSMSGVYTNDRYFIAENVQIEH